MDRPVKTCPHCGGELPRAAAKFTPKYPTAEARRAALVLGYKAATDRRAERDRAQVYPLLRKHKAGFGSGDVGEALRAVGRLYSENSAVLMRGVDRGWIRLVGERRRGRRLVRAWRVVVDE
jgi:hypothetical protein